MAENATDLGYTNPRLNESLSAAARVVLDIIRNSSHPVMHLWHHGDWRSKLEGRKHTLPIAFLSHHPVPGLPGDKALMLETVAAMEVDLRTTPSDSLTLDGRSAHIGEILDRLRGPGHLLLELVIVRTYLNRGSEDDDTIFEL